MRKTLIYLRVSGNSKRWNPRLSGGRGSCRAARWCQEAGSAGASPSQFPDTLIYLTVLVCLFLTTEASPAETKRETYDVVVERDVMVEMRDGVRLATDVYYPAKDGKPIETKLPALLMRTAYNKERWGPDIVRFFARHGYISVTQDCRGRYKSEGRFFPWVDDPEDGYDTIEWIARLPRSNGRVGMHGPSHMAWVQFHAATQKPPHLVAMAPYQGPINAYKYSMRTGGALHLGVLKWVVKQAATGQNAPKDPEAKRAIAKMGADQEFLKWGTRIPWQRGKTPLAAFPDYEDAAFQLYFENNDYNDFWRQPGLGMDEYFDRFPDMPILWITSWFDWYPRTISDGYQAMVARGRKDQYLIVGPWTHWNNRYAVGDVNFPNDGGGIASRSAFLDFELAWFDRYLKGDTSKDVGPPVQYYEMGGGDGQRGAGGRLNHGGHWRRGDAWPPDTVRPSKYFLHASGELSTAAPAEEPSSTTYVYDPNNTVSSNGRCIISYGPSAGRSFAGMGPQDQIQFQTLPGHGTPGRPIVERDDVVMFQTPPLAEDVVIAGNIGVTLWVSSDAPDTDFYVKLVDVHPPNSDYPRGYGFPVSEGILRARYREGFEQPALMQQRQKYRLTFPLEPAANRFMANHRIQIYICSSNFPNFDINRNTGDPTSHHVRIARNTIHHDALHPSSIELPIRGMKKEMR